MQLGVVFDTNKLLAKLITKLNSLKRSNKLLLKLGWGWVLLNF